MISTASTPGNWQPEITDSVDTHAPQGVVGTMKIWRNMGIALMTATLLSGTAGCVSEASVGASGDWPMFRGDPAGTGYSRMSEITRENVAGLRPAWSYSLSAELADGPSGQEAPRPVNSQATPIVVEGVMYVPASDGIVALEPTTGQVLWRHTLADGAPSRRGVAYWPGGAGRTPRILFTSGRRLMALEAGTGTPVDDFGDAGEVDLVVPYLSVPFVYQDVVVVGANTPPGSIGGIGNARAYDAITGRKIWEFDSVPQPGSVGHETWVGDSWRDRLGANAWPFYFTMDPERELLYLPLASPIPGAYGGDREGANLFGNSVVAVNIHTGEYVWHFQTIHHDLWDADPPAPPVLLDLPNDGQTVPALGITTKSGYIYFLNRATGEPIFGVEERPAPGSAVPGEAAYPTQPFPVLPPPVARVGYEPSDLVSADDTSLEHASACAELVEQIGIIHNEGPFTPWIYRPEGSPPAATLLFPGLVGGPNWGGAAFDPNTGYVFVFSQDLGSFGWAQPTDEGAPLPYDRSGPQPSSFDVPIGELRLPCQKPPWGQLFAIDTRTGEFAWQRPVGVTESLPPDRALTGRPGRAATIVTASGLLFIASTDDNRFRALDAVTGEELWMVSLPDRGNANPMTYRGADGRQYVAVVATDRVMVYALP
ncbi:MAG: PQQ-binding-like beta-propeller repeat protein [Gemmatimonas sp.]|nr:PQQ-binding-like beta-propeller repeat protein [Gemmatimonas sp.]